MSRTLLGPLWVTTFRDPVRTGRLRLDGLSRSERLVARCGLVLMILLLVSLLFSNVWRNSDLTPISVLSDPRFVPAGLVPVTLVAFLLSVLMLVWGAFDAAPSVRLATAGFYALTASILSNPGVFAIQDTWMLVHGPTLVRVGFWLPVAALVVSFIVGLLPARAQLRVRWHVPVLRAITALGLVAVLVAHLGMNADFVDAGYPSGLPSFVHGGFTNIGGLLIPLTLIAAVAVTDFATDVSTSLGEPVSRARTQWLGILRWALLAVLVTRILTSTLGNRQFWISLLSLQPITVGLTLGGLAVLAAPAVYVVRRAPAGSDDDVDEVKERVTLAAAFLLATPLLVQVALLGLIQFTLIFTPEGWGFGLVEAYPLEVMDDLLPLVAAVAAALVGWRLTRRPVSSTSRRCELGTVLLLVGTWNAAALTANVTGLGGRFSYPLFELVLTVGVLGWLVVRWRSVGAAELSMLLAIAVFTWLALGRGDYLTFAGSLLGLPGVLVIVFGILYTLMSGSGFTNESSARLPREARTLMYVGYLLLSVTILHWYEVIHDSANEFEDFGFYFLALPIAAWLLIRRIIPRQLGVAPGHRLQLPRR